ncbi:hypothetical protein D3C73_1089630 [compost metagenome]
MQQQGDIQGYDQVLWNGVTTLELSKAVEWSIQHDIRGLIHLAAPSKLSKHALLILLRSTFAREQVTIHTNNQFQSDKSLRSTRSDFSYVVPPYPQMLDELNQWMNTHSKGIYNY